MTEAWIDVRDRLPEKGGRYRVLRRSLGNRPPYEDVCRYTPAINASPPYWSNSRGVIIKTVEAWKGERIDDDREGDQRADAGV